MFKNLMGITALLVSCFFGSAAAQETPTETSENSIAKIENNKAYLKAGSVQVAKNGIFIYVEGQLIAVDHLDSDDDGVYIELDKIRSASFCPSCGGPLILGLFCGNPDCGRRLYE